MGKLSAYPGQIEVRGDGCYVDGTKLPECPKIDQSLLSRPFMQKGIVSGHLDLFPPNPGLEVRNDFVFFLLLFVITFSLLMIATLRVKIFGLNLNQYLKPIWYFVLLTLVVVFWQYQFGLDLGNGLAIRISQAIWEVLVFLSAYKLIKEGNFSCKICFS